MLKNVLNLPLQVCSTHSRWPPNVDVDFQGNFPNAFVSAFQRVRSFLGVGRGIFAKIIMSYPDLTAGTRWRKLLTRFNVQKFLKVALRTKQFQKEGTSVQNYVRMVKTCLQCWSDSFNTHCILTRVQFRYIRGWAEKRIKFEYVRGLARQQSFLLVS